MYSRKGNNAFPCNPRNPYPMCVLPSWSQLPSSPQERTPQLSLWQMSCSSTTWVWAPHGVCNKPMPFSTPAPSPWSGEVFFWYDQCCSLNVPSLSPQKGFPPFPKPWHQFFSHPVHFHVPCTCHAVSLQLWPVCLPPTVTNLSQSSDGFSGCCKWSDLNTAVFEGGGQPRVPLLLYHLNSSPLYSNFKRCSMEFVFSSIF